MHCVFSTAVAAHSDQRPGGQRGARGVRVLARARRTPSVPRGTESLPDEPRAAPRARHEVLGERRDHSQGELRSPIVFLDSFIPVLLSSSSRFLNPVQSSEDSTDCHCLLSSLVVRSVRCVAYEKSTLSRMCPRSEHLRSAQSLIINHDQIR